ncbi:GGDEF domain-containing protein [Teredinibacter haidensis]|uniref:GGDEF domain-containing protein n=1 Tax=Teredinibacter haidensis TaxID=2731755 RepID=UPI000948D18E|nr:GGDEF domain-containing protein [Teredinibacter haidensis]
MTPKLFNTIRIIAFVLTLLAVLGQRYLPPRALDIHPIKSNHFELYTDQQHGGRSTIDWLDESRSRWKCTVLESNTYPVCGLAIVFSREPYQSIDFSRYSSIRLRLAYDGESSKIRLFFRNMNIAYADTEDLELSKFQSVTVRTSDLQTSIDIQLSEFYVADWWKDEYDIPREYSQPEANSVVAVGIDLAPPISYGEHIYELQSIQLVGEWVSRESLYLAIIFGWMLVLGWEAIVRMTYWSSHAKRSSARVREARRESERYKELVNIDPLTGILNRSGLSKIIDEMPGKNQRLTDYSVLVLDIDHFKHVNDKHGHDAGDDVLLQFAELLTGCVRDEDIAVRWGGEEFVVLLKTTNLQKAQAAAEDICQEISNTEFKTDPPIHITASIGIAIANAEENFKSVFKRADSALYQAKFKGRNCVEVYTS